MKKQQLTIKDIARIAKVSPSAVSIALNKREGISDKTREKILALIKELDYVPNQQARRLLLKYTNNIGVLHGQHNSPLQHLFLMAILSSALAKGENLGYNFIISAVRESSEVQVPDIVKNRDVDGLMVIGELPLEVLKEIQGYEIPMVLVDEHLREKNTVAIEADYQHGARLAAEYLITKGHKRIGYIGVVREKNYGEQTYAGFIEALEAAGIPGSAGLILPAAKEETEEAGFRAMNKILSAPRLPTAVFCAADIFAIGAMRAVKEGGFTIPRDISVMGMDNIILSHYVEPPLTTIRFHMEQMGETAMDTLIGIIKKEYRGEKKIFFKGALVERQSVCPPSSLST